MFRGYSFDVDGNLLHRHLYDSTTKYTAVSTTLFDGYGVKRVELDSESGGAFAGDWVGYKGQFGYFTDSESGLIYCQQRYYDPANARWINRDPIGLDGGVNVYRYVSGNPISGVDPSGLRDLTQREIYLLGKMYNPKFWRSEKGKTDDLLKNVNASVREIKELIDLMKDNEAMPAHLKALFWSLDKLGDISTYSNDFGNRASGNGVLGAKPGENKCNLFVADSYVLGAGLPYNSSFGVPVREGRSGRTPIAANTWYLRQGRQGAFNTTVAWPGAIAGFGSGSIDRFDTLYDSLEGIRARSGHAMIYLGGGLLIGASDKSVRLANITQVATQEC
jgi:RHS repeat-associated protein